MYVCMYVCMYICIYVKWDSWLQLRNFGVTFIV